MLDQNKKYKEPINNDSTVSKLINVLSVNGNKTIIEEIVCKSLQLIKKNTKQSPLTVLKIAIFNIRPTITLKSVKIAGKSYQIPFPINKEKQDDLAIQWLVEAVDNKSEKTLIDRLYQEIVNAYNKKGSAYKKKDDIHHKAVANRTYIQYRW
jgi:small subunit ribosomal protein S7